VVLALLDLAAEEMTARASALKLAQEAVRAARIDAMPRWRPPWWRGSAD
jgi:hypothetical protein